MMSLFSIFGRTRLTALECKALRLAAIFGTPDNLRADDPLRTALTKLRLIEREGGDRRLILRDYAGAVIGVIGQPIRAFLRSIAVVEAWLGRKIG